MGRAKLDIKRFSEYTKDEQMELMFHWFYYYGKSPVSFEELDRFKKLMDEDMSFVRNAALVAWAREEMPQALVKAMRGDFGKYHDEIVAVSTTVEFEGYEEELEKELIGELVHTYNNPQAAVPMTDEQLMEEICRIFGADSSEVQMIKISAEDILKEMDTFGIVLTSEKVHEIYRECLLKEEELANGEPAVDFTVGEGIQHTGVFNTERLERRRDEITAMIDELPDIEQGPSFLSLCYDKHGRQWTGEHPTMDLLMQLGRATETIVFPLPREVWPAIGGVPLVLRVHDKDNQDLRTHKPKEFKKVKDELDRGIYGKGAK